MPVDLDHGNLIVYTFSHILSLSVYIYIYIKFPFLDHLQVNKLTIQGINICSFDIL